VVHLSKQGLITAPEIISVNLLDDCEYNKITLGHIQSGKPQPNGFTEHFNDSFRQGFLNTYLFEPLSLIIEMA